MRRIAALIALSAALLVPNVHAAGLDQTCELTATRFDADTVNVLFPDSSAQYWTGSYRAIPGTHIRIDGTYPYARYTSWNVYDPILRPFAKLSDYQIFPDAGSANPFWPGGDRRSSTSARHYTVYITFDAGFTPAGANPANVIYVDPSKNPVGFFTLRVYVPDAGKDVTGGVGLPQITWEPNGGETVAPVASPCTNLEKPSISTVNDSFAKQDGPDNWPVQFPGRNPPGWHKFVNLCYSGQDLLFENPTVPQPPNSGSNPCDSAGSGGFLSNKDNAYIYTGISRSYGPIVAFHGKAPTFEHTYPSEPTTAGGANLRYWSFCENDPFTQRYIGCARDDQVKTDKSGDYTIVVSPPSKWASPKKCAGKVTWIPWGPQPYGTIILRHMLPGDTTVPPPPLSDSAFPQAIQNIPVADARNVSAIQSEMGAYYPSGRYFASSKAVEKAYC